MKQETYDLAWRIQDRISSLTLMQATLKETFVNLTKNNNMDDAQKLANLIYELMEKPKGDSVVDSFVNHFYMKYDKWINRLHKEFEEL